MPRELSESVSGAVELIFPGDADGQEYRLRELGVYEAEEVREELGDGDVPQYGDWMKVVTEMDEEAWLCAPSQLRKRLLDEEVEPGNRVTIHELKKTGSRQSDPYRAEISVNRGRDDEQSGLTGSDD